MLSARISLIAMAFTLSILPREVLSQKSYEGASFSVTSARQAREVVLAAVQAAGGLDALRRISTVMRTLTSERRDEGQGARPGDYARAFDRIGALPPIVNRSQLTTFRDLRGQRSVDHLQYDIYGGQYVSRRAVLGATEGFNAYYDYVYHGIRTLVPAALVRSKAAAFRRYPESLLQSLHDRPESVRSLADAQWEGRPHRVLAFADVDGTQLTLFFDAASHRLSKWETVADDGVMGDVASEVVYDDYRAVKDVTLPFRIVDRRGGVVLDDARIGSTVLDVPLPDSLFARPAGFDDVDFGKPFPNYQKLGDNVHAMLGGYNAIFVELDQYVVVLEAGGSSREAEAVIAKIKETAPGKPIRYLISTHWNYDHLSGVRPYIAEGTTIIAPPSARPVIERAAAAKHVLRPDALSRNPRKPVFEPLGGKQRTFTDGTRSVVIYDITPSPHSDEMFIAYLPTQRILFEADMLDITVPGHAGSGGDDTADFAARISQLGLAVDKIVPVHGQIGTMEDLRQSLDRRAARKAK